MAVEIHARLIGSEKVLSMFKAAGPIVTHRLIDEMNRQTINIQNKVVLKLTGPVLKTRTGLLRNSINQRVEETVSGVTGTVGTNVVYAAIHEFGGTIHHPGGTAYFVDKDTGQSTFIANSNPLAEQLLRTKPHDIPMPERSFLRSTLTEETPNAIAAFKQALAEAMKEAKGS